MTDLAKLVVRLEANSAQLLSELEKSQSRLKAFERSATSSLDTINKKFEAFGFGIKTALAGFLGGVSFKAIVDANIEASKSFANLENAVERAGAAAGGRTADQFAATAKEIANVTTASGNAVQGVQQLLLRFQNIRTDRFDEATKTALDLSAALGIDLTSAAELVGKALSNPEKGLTALRKAGIGFSDAQTTVINKLVDTGRRAEAQGIILDKLGQKFGGAAEKLRDTFGGALDAVKNSLGDLMESKDGLPGATTAMNELAKTLQDPGVKAGADALFSLLVTGAAKAAELIGKTAAGVAVLFNQGGDRVQKLSQEIEFLEKERKSFLPFVTNIGGGGDQSDIFPKGGFFTEVLTPSEIDKKIQELRDAQDAILGLGTAGAKAAAETKTAFNEIAGAYELPDIEVIDGLTAAEKKLLEALKAQGKTLTESLKTPFEKFNEQLTKADKLLAANAINWTTWQRAVSKAATEFDATLGSVAFDNWQASSNKAATALEPLLEKLRQANAGVHDLGVGISQKLQVQDANIDVAGEVNAQTDAELDKLDKASKDAAHRSQIFAEEAARNIQDIIGNGLESALHDGVANGAKGALQAFGAMLEKMAIQAIAADIGSKLFGNGSTGGATGGAGAGVGGTSGGGFGALISKGIDIFSHFFGGTRDSGGRGTAGQAVMIGRGAQPEMFVPDTSGEFYPAGSWPGGGGQRVTQNIYTSSPITPRSARQLALEAGRQQRVAAARLA